MKIKCVKIINEHTQQQQLTSHWLKIGNIYVVLQIEVYPTKNYFLIVDESSNQAPHLHDAKQFEVITNYIPTNWQIHSGNLEIVTIGPKSWQASNFWDECYNGDEAMLKIYKTEARIIMEEETLL